MKRIYLGLLLVIGLILVGCGGTETAPVEEAQPTQLTPADLGVERGELRTQAPGDPAFLPDFAFGEVWGIGINTPEGGGLTAGTELLRHFNSLAQVDPVTPENQANPTFEQDIRWRLVKGLATGPDNSGCFSLESTNFPGQFLRHADFRVRMDPNDGSELFAADATWCAREPLSGSLGDALISFASFNFPDYYLRRFGDLSNREVWIARPDGASPQNTPDNFAAEAIWSIFPLD